MANNANNDEKWYFSKEQLESTPSRKCGLDAYKELQYRQQAANFIQDMGQRLKVTQLCINTAIVYMHRFYVFHSFTHFPWQSIASAALFLAAKVEEQPRKLEHVIKVAHLCKSHNNHANFDINSERYQAMSQDLVFNENILLQTLGFDVAIDHPHTHVVKCCHLVRASKDLAQTSYFLASNSLHLTTMCLQYRPTVVACFCIHLACKWSNWEIPLSNEQKEWFSYIDPTVTADLLHQLCVDFLEIYDRCPSRLKEKVMIMSSQDNEKKLMPPNDPKDPKEPPSSGGHPHRVHHSESKPGQMDDLHKHRSSRPHDPGTSQQQREREYREKKERERLAQHASSKSSMPPSQSNKQPLPHGHHRPPVDAKMKQHSSRPPSMGGHPSSSSRPPEAPRDILREATLKDKPRDILRDATTSGMRDYRYGNREVNDPNALRDSLNREMHDSQVRSDKDMQKRDCLLKPNVTETNSVNSYQESRAMYNNTDKSIDPARSRPIDPTKYPVKHESARRHEENKLYIKSESDVKKEYKSSSVYDKNNAYVNKSMNSTSQKTKSPFETDVAKSVPKHYSQQPHMNMKQEPHNGNTNNGSGYVPPVSDMKVKMEGLEVKEEPPFYMPVKKPSLFSPEKSPPKKSVSPPLVNRPVTPTKRDSLSSVSNIPESFSPFESPSISEAGKRKRNSSSSSEQELRLVMKKIDQVEGFETLLRDPSIGIKMHQVPDIITPISDSKPEKAVEAQISKELKPPDIIPPFTSANSAAPGQPLVNGIETNPTLIRNLLKEAPAVSHLPSIAAPTPEVAPVIEKPIEVKEKEREHHHKSKKKNKEKHKHKDKDRSKDEKKKKHKDKDREKHRSKSEKHESLDTPAPEKPIKITIPKDKIHPPTPPENSLPSGGGGIKIKIPKERIKADTIGESASLQGTPSGGLKIKIPREVIKNSSFGSESRKRERDRSPSETTSSKSLKMSYSSRNSDSKQNGRSSYSKVAHLGDGDTSMHRLAESKYINKGAPS